MKIKVLRLGGLASGDEGLVASEGPTAGFDELATTGGKTEAASVD